MRKLYEICTTLQEMQCSIHFQNPTVTIIRNGIKVVDCCCNDFRKELMEVIDIKIDEQLQKGLDDELDNESDID